MLRGLLFCYQGCICVNRVVFVSAGLFLCRQGCFCVLCLLVCWQGCYYFDRVITVLAVFELLVLKVIPLSGGLKLIFRFYFRDVASCFLQ